MKILPAVMLLSAGVAFLTFTALSLAIQPRPFSATGPMGLVVAIGLAGAIFVVLACRQFYRLNQVVR